MIYYIPYVRPSGKGAHQDSFENAPPGSVERKVWDQLLSKDPGGLIIEKEAYAREVLNRPNAMGKVTFIVDLRTWHHLASSLKMDNQH